MKTRGFREPKYVGDPLNAVRIFNEKEVDEIMVADMDAKVNGKEPDFGLIGKLAAECRMPLCYAGGITTADQVEKIVGLGVEKVGISSGAIENPGLIEESARRVGNQSVVVVMDVGRAASGYELFICNGKIPPVRSAVKSEEAPGDLDGACRKQDSDSGIEQPVGDGATGRGLTSWFHLFVSRKGTF